MQNEVYKATLSYGYGLQTTFIQILSAYNIFNNSGNLVIPKIANYFSFNNRYQNIEPSEETNIISRESAEIMKNILIENVKRGTGRKTQVEGITVGGKTGTAHIALDGFYAKSYNSSFFGFVSDGNRSYTMGVTVFEPKDKYFASQTAVPLYKEIIETMIKQGYLKRKKEKN